jgi:hypothetical protein
MINHTIHQENVKRYVYLNHPDNNTIETETTFSSRNGSPGRTIRQAQGKLFDKRFDFGLRPTLHLNLAPACLTEHFIFFRIDEGNGRIKGCGSACTFGAVLFVTLFQITGCSGMKRNGLESKDVEPGMHNSIIPDLSTGSRPFRRDTWCPVGDLEQAKGAPTFGGVPLCASKWLPGQDSNLQPSG